MITNRKAVSRERLIGISFVDILIQAVFILFLALTVGYTDPVNLMMIKEYAVAGKDLCTKINKDSVKECKEVIEATIDKEATKKGDLMLCLNPQSKTNAALSARFIVLNPKEVRFVEFTPQYINYLEKKGDTERLAKIKSIKPGIYATNAIVPTFGFIRESSCFHSVTIRNWEGTWTQAELRDPFTQLSQLQGILN